MSVNFGLLQSPLQNPQGQQGLQPSIIQPQQVTQAPPPPAPSSGGLEGLLKGFSSFMGGMKGLGGQTPSTPNTSSFGTGLLNQTQNPYASIPVQQSANAQNAVSKAITPEFMHSPAYQSSLSAYHQAQQQGITKSPYMAVVDYSLPANQDRLFVVNTNTNKIDFQSPVTHGGGSGKGLTPTSFSNTPNSHQSSLGTYITGNTYNGEHGLSMRVQGLDKGINDNAASRDIVVHGSNYIGNGKTGTSWGCFAVPQDRVPQLTQLLNGGAIIHAYAPNSPTSNPQQINQTIKNSPNLAQNMTHNAMQAIAEIESGESKNPYTLQSKPSRNGDRALGKYQIMGNNVGPWSKEAIGHSVSKEEFLASPELQEQIAGFHINKYVTKYGPNGAGRAWFGGEGGMDNYNATDVYGTSVGGYGKKFNSLYQKYSGQQQSLNEGPNMPPQIPQTIGKPSGQIPQATGLLASNDPWVTPPPNPYGDQSVGGPPRSNPTMPFMQPGAGGSNMPNSKWPGSDRPSQGPGDHPEPNFAQLVPGGGINWGLLRRA